MLESGCAARPRGIFTVFVISNKAGSYARININNVSVRERLIQSSPGRCGIFGNHRTFRHCWNIHVLSVTRTECRPHIPRFSKTSSRCIPPWGGGRGRGVGSRAGYRLSGRSLADPSRSKTEEQPRLVARRTEIYIHVRDVHGAQRTPYVACTYIGGKGLRVSLLDYGTSG